MFSQGFSTVFLALSTIVTNIQGTVKIRDFSYQLIIQDSNSVCQLEIEDRLAFEGIR